VPPSYAAKELQVPPQSITRAVADLMEAGLVRRVGNAADGRSYSIELTDAGRQARADFRQQLSADFSLLGRRHCASIGHACISFQGSTVGSPE
jgi:DNA-binding MarR family transcriptional regulator